MHFLLIFYKYLVQLRLDFLHKLWDDTFENSLKMTLEPLLLPNPLVLWCNMLSLCNLTSYFEMSLAKYQFSSPYSTSKNPIINVTYEKKWTTCICKCDWWNSQRYNIFTPWKWSHDLYNDSLSIICISTHGFLYYFSVVMCDSS